MLGGETSREPVLKQRVKRGRGIEHMAVVKHLPSISKDLIPRYRGGRDIEEGGSEGGREMARDRDKGGEEEEILLETKFL